MDLNFKQNFEMFLFHEACVENEDTLISCRLLTVISFYFDGVLFAPEKYINQRDLKIRGDYDCRRG